MAFLALAGFVLVVAVLVRLSSLQRQRVGGCCAPADPRDDLRMRSAYDNEHNEAGRGSGPAAS